MYGRGLRADARTALAARSAASPPARAGNAGGDGGPLERSTARLIARGLLPGAARREAVREFGNVAYMQEEARFARGTRRLDAPDDLARIRGSHAAGEAGRSSRTFSEDEFFAYRGLIGPFGRM